MFLIMVRGAIFCQVINSIQLFHLIFLNISGIHLWNGAAPNLINSLIVIIMFIIIVMKGFLNINLINTIVNSNILLILWVKK